MPERTSRSPSWLIAVWQKAPRSEGRKEVWAGEVSAGLGTSTGLQASSCRVVGGRSAVLTLPPRQVPGSRADPAWSFPAAFGCSSQHSNHTDFLCRFPRSRFAPISLKHGVCVQACLRAAIRLCNHRGRDVYMGPTTEAVSSRTWRTIQGAMNHLVPGGYFCFSLMWQHSLGKNGNYLLKLPLICPGMG